jgi:hypothetical protein
MAYQFSRFPTETVMSVLNQQKQREQQAKTSSLDNLVQALQIMANKYSENKATERKSAVDINREANKATTEAYLKGQLKFSSPATTPLEPGVAGPSAPERPYAPNIRELLSGKMPPETIVKPDTTIADALKSSTTNLNNTKLEQMKGIMALQKELTTDPVAFKNKYGDEVLQMIRALPPFNVMDLINGIGTGSGGFTPPNPATPGTQPKSPATPTGSVDTPPPMPGTTVGQKKLDKVTNKTWTWDGTKWTIGG